MGWVAAMGPPDPVNLPGKTRKHDLMHYLVNVICHGGRLDALPFELGDLGVERGGRILYASYRDLLKGRALGGCRPPDQTPPFFLEAPAPQTRRLWLPPPSHP